MHDGSQIVLRKADGAYDPTDSVAAYQYIHKHRAAGEIVTGLIYIDETQAGHARTGQYAAGRAGDPAVCQALPGQEDARIHTEPVSLGCVASACTRGALQKVFAA